MEERFKHKKELFLLSVPVIITSVIMEATVFVTMLFVGRLKDEEHGPVYIGAATLGNMLCAVSGYSLASGMCTALDALVSQAYGAKSYRLMGLYCQRAIAILSIFSIFITLVWLQTEFVLEKCLHLDNHIAKLAGHWAKLMILGLWPGLISEIIGKFLTCQQIVWPVLVCSGLGALANAGATYILVHRYEMGFTGCGLGFVLSKWIYLITLIFTIFLRKFIIRQQIKTNSYQILNINDETDLDSSQNMIPLGTISSERTNKNVINHVDSGFTDSESDLDMVLELEEEQDEEETSESDSMMTPLQKSKHNQHRINSNNNNNNNNNNNDHNYPTNNHRIHHKTNTSTSIFDHKNLTKNQMVFDHSNENQFTTTATLSEAVIMTNGSNTDTDRGEAEGDPDPEDNWPAFSVVEVFSDWVPFLKLGIPGALSLCIEWGSFELAAGIVGQLGTVPLAAHGIFASTAGLTYMIPASVSFSTATLAGNLLGAGKHVEAYNVIVMGMISVFLLAIFWAALMLVLGTTWCAVYTNDSDVLQLLNQVLPMFALYLFVDSLKCVTTIILRSSGRPAVTVWGNGVACLVCMLPLGYLLTVYLRFGLWGEWFAMSVSWLLSATVYFTIIMSTDWKEQSEIAIQRSSNSDDNLVKLTPQLQQQQADESDKNVIHGYDANSV